MANRKLQGEIDRTLKKVQEGGLEFETTMEKVYSAPTQNQREKHEADLKKEIKKLQRYREQIKQWMALPDKEVKDKKALMEARKTIERHMEDFRGCEKETKTKAYSKEGLQKQTVQKDTKGPLRAWLQECIDDITEQLKTYESQLSDFALSDDPDVLEKTITLEHRIERHQFHLEHLEYLLSAWENDTVTKQQIKSIRDAVNEYIAENENEDYYENEELYEEAGINTEGSVLIVDDDQLNAVSEPASDADGANEKLEETTEKVPPKEEPKPVAVVPPKKERESPSKKEAAKNPRPVEEPKKVETKKTTRKVNEAPPPARTEVAKPKQQKSPPKPAAAAAKPEKLQAVQATTKAAPSSPRAPKPSSPRPAPAEVSEPKRAPVATPSTTTEQLSQKMKNMDIRPPADDSDNSDDDRKNDSTFSANLSQIRAGTLEEMSSATSRAPWNNNSAPAGPTPPSQQQRAMHASHDGFPSADQMDPAAARRREMVQVLERGARFMPKDSSTFSTYAPQNPASTPAYYPKEPPLFFDSPNFYKHCRLDTLFFIFYYVNREPQHTLAARELNNRSWRFHTKYLTWFQRREEPTETTAEYEVGTYVYFDYAPGWCQRKKTGFTFDYQFLERQFSGH